MSIPVVCACGKATLVPAQKSGQRTRCPRCQAMVVVPTLVLLTPRPYESTVGPVPLGDSAALRRRPLPGWGRRCLWSAAVGLVALSWSSLLWDRTPLEPVSGVRLVARLVTQLTLVPSVIALPLGLPPVLARRGYLSIRRWLILSGLAAILGLSGAWLFHDAFPLDEGRDASHLRFGLGLIVVALLLAFVGCVGAAAISRKVPPRS